MDLTSLDGVLRDYILASAAHLRSKAELRQANAHAHLRALEVDGTGKRLDEAFERCQKCISEFCEIEAFGPEYAGRLRIMREAAKSTGIENVTNE